MSATLVWFRRDLRISDHPALAWALNRPGAVIPLFIWAPEEEAPWQPGAASRWWLHHALTALNRQLVEHGTGLVVREGTSLETIQALVRETGATAICWNERYEPAGRRVDDAVARALRAEGVTVSIHNGALLHNPDEIRTGGDTPYRVFTPFWKKLQQQPELGAPLPEVNLSIGRAPASMPASVPIDRLRLLPTLPWDAGFYGVWEPGEAGARRALARFLDGPAGAYDTDRNRPDRPGTSRLSPHLCFGEISPHTIWRAVRERMPAGDKPAQVFLSEIAWREFSYHLLFHFPGTTDQPLNPRFTAFPWREDPAALRLWQRGQTGYPIVDAGLRELWATGWMHNRVRMIVASFLTKDLLIPWQAGARWFWDTLVDADLANNTQGWQWSAGCGADAQPFFRIFNPVSQGERFDPDGAYVRRWVPELARFPAAQVHAPWMAPLFAAGAGYPEPMLEHGRARDAALDAFARLPPA
ncbi:MAG: deoxyribodipyrimidine photo-lyase [Rhodothermales bacterium]|nr:deoxyribodipyrimidine photo-lyase [Rhodothermales bacterium]